MRELIDKMLEMEISEELIEAVVCILETEEQYEKMSQVLDNLQKLTSTTILGKAILIADEN